MKSIKPRPSSSSFALSSVSPSRPMGRLAGWLAAAAALLVAWLAPSASAQFGLNGGGVPEVELRIVPQSETVAAGGQAVIAVVLDHQPGWHSHLNEPVIPEAMGDFEAIATIVRVASSPGATAGPAQYPKPYTAMVDFLFSGEPVPYQVYEGRAAIFVPLLIDPDASGEIPVTLSIQYQACDDTTCLIPEFLEREVTLRVVEPTLAGADAPDHGDLFADFDPGVFAAMAEGTVQAKSTASTGASEGRTFFGIPLPAEGSPARLIVLALLAAVGGFVLNLTPCVLPVLPIKVMTISHHAGSPGKSLYLGIWMAVGVVAFWLALGLPVALTTSITDPSIIFGIWWVTLGIGLIIGIMGAGIMGLFTINLPDKVYMVNPKADSAGGSFMFGVMTAVLGLPCFGFVAGALLAGAATLPASTILVIFGSLGVGMASPYLVLSANPKWVDKLPKTGPASELIKQIMGLLLLAAAAYFVGAGLIALLADSSATLPWWSKTVHWWVIAAFVSAAGLWLLYRTVRITKSVGKRGVFAVIGLLLAAASVAYAADTTGKARNNFWTPFDEDRLAAALEDGQIVVVDFTAEWCLNCKALKAAVLMREPVKSRLLSGEVTPLVADLTSRKAPGWDKLRDLQQTGIPLLAVYGPGQAEPWLANAYTAEEVLRALEMQGQTKILLH
ncbi:MAG: thioredoxin family protein [Planctomycetota bacterium]